MSTSLKAVWRTAWIDSYKTKDGKSFRVRYINDEGKRQTAGTFVTRNLADEFSSKFEEHLNDPSKPFPTIGTIVNAGGTSGLSWEEKVEEFATAGSLKPSTRVTRRSRLNRFGTMMSIKHTGQLTPSVVNRFCIHLRDVDKQSASTIAGYLRVLDTFYRWLKQMSPINDAIKSDWKPHATYVKARPHFYTKDEYRKLLIACDGVGRLCYNEKEEPTIAVNPGERDAVWWKTYISVLYWMGLRLEEVSHLIWHDIDLNAGEMKIQPHEGLPGVFPWSPKGKAKRDLVMPPELVDLLRQMKGRCDPNVPYVFLMRDRYEFYKKHGIKEENRHMLHSVLQGFKRVRNRAGIIEGDIHDFRRTFVTRWMDESGVNPRDVQEMAGHADVNTTLKIYTMMREGQAKKKVRAVYDKLGGGIKPAGGKAKKKKSA